MTEPSKKDLRAQLRRHRRDLAAGRIPPLQALPHFLAWLKAEAATARPASIALYAAIGDEFNPLPLAPFLEREGVTLALPTISRDADRPLLFRRWSPGDPLAAGPRLDIPEPGAHAAEITPDLFFVPLLGFDKAGNRIGYGKGDYDRTLARRRDEYPATLAIGFAFAGQEVEKIPAEPHDQKLDAILTERELRWFRA